MIRGRISPTTHTEEELGTRRHAKEFRPVVAVGDGEGAKRVCDVFWILLDRTTGLARTSGAVIVFRLVRMAGIATANDFCTKWSLDVEELLGKERMWFGRV